MQELVKMRKATMMAKTSNNNGNNKEGIVVVVVVIYVASCYCAIALSGLFASSSSFF
jgi:hypothetical protein